MPPGPGPAFILVLLTLNASAAVAFATKRNWPWALIYGGATLIQAGSLWATR